MSVRVRRGLGLLVVAVIAFVLYRVVSPQVGDWPDVVAVPLLLVSVVAFAVGFFGGLVLLAWGLLRD